MYPILFIASMVGMAIVARIKNDIIRAAVGIPMIIAMFSLGMMTFASIISAQWVPDRDEYKIVSPGNFHTQAHDMSTAVSIALGTLEYNGVKMRTIDVDKNNIDVPIFNHLHKPSREGYVYLVYVTRTETGYVVWFRYIIDHPIIFEEKYADLQYEGVE